MSSRTPHSWLCFTFALNLHIQFQELSEHNLGILQARDFSCFGFFGEWSYRVIITHILTASNQLNDGYFRITTNWECMWLSWVHVNNNGHQGLACSHLLSFFISFYQKYHCPQLCLCTYNATIPSWFCSNQKRMNGFSYGPTGLLSLAYLFHLVKRMFCWFILLLLFFHPLQPLGTLSSLCEWFMVISIEESERNLERKQSIQTGKDWKC